jgi:hypothetical protein
MPGSASAYECPLCLGEEFVDFKGRGTVRCATCGSIPRTRIAWLLLRDYARLRPGARVAHFAPEPTLAMRLLELCGAGYEPYDLDPGRYQARMPFVKVAACDLCTDLGDFAAGAYDAIVHNHVMEHLPCNHVMVLLQMQDLLKTGGVQVFSVPVTRGRTRSDMDPGLLAAQRTRHFGQWDHMVKFGADDHDMNLGRVFGQTNDSYHLEDLLDETALRRANIPVAQWRPSGSTVFAVRKR